MDFVKKFTEGENQPQGQQLPEGEKKQGGGFMDQFNNMAGGGQAGENKEDYLDKGMQRQILCNGVPVRCFM